MLRFLEPWHLIVLLVLVAVLFGGKRLPDAARGLGRSLRIFKAEVKEMKEDDRRRDASGGPSDALEGRVVDTPKDAPPGRATAAPESTRDA